jgi:hypothetical protein
MSPLLIEAAETFRRSMLLALSGNQLLKVVAALKIIITRVRLLADPFYAKETPMRLINR